ncbi:MAG: methylmalonyl-CoA mutase, partial [Candidatus Zixiibacteriota bacterium]
DEFAPRLSFFFAAHSDLLEEVAKFRAARRLWAKIMQDRFGAKNDRSLLLRFHTQTGGCTLTAQQPENNIVRTAFQALAATFGGTQSLHTNSFDEALGLPTEQSAQIALRTQQLIACESGITNTVDPLAGSYFVEYLTDELEKNIAGLIEHVDDLGGSIRCIESGYFQEEIARSAYAYQKRIETGDSAVVGVNQYQSDRLEVPAVLKVDPELEQKQVAHLGNLRSRRDQDRVTASLQAVRESAEAGNNIVHSVVEAVESYATIGEISDVFREIWGEYHDSK